MTMLLPPFLTRCDPRLRVVQCLLLFVLFGALTARSLAEPRPDSATLKNRVILALGGSDHLQALHALRASGHMEGISGFPGTYEMLSVFPDRRIETWDIRYLRQTTAVDGTTGWEKSAAVRELAGPELIRDREDARFNTLYVLLENNTPFVVTRGECSAETPAYLMQFETKTGSKESFGVDPKSYLPLCHVSTQTYEEGPTQVLTRYGDYRRVKGLMLPYVIEETKPDNALKIVVEHYEVNPKIDLTVFKNPMAAHFDEPVQLELSTLPAHIYMEEDGHYTMGDQRYWGMYFYPTESWSLDLMVRETYGRFVSPERTRAVLFAGNQELSSQQWERGSLAALRRYPVARFTPQGEIYGFRHNFTVASIEHVDHILFTFDGKAADGRVYSQTLDVPITVYQSKNRLIFPMRGKFLITSGHEYHEKEHKYERSQQFAIDIVALGDNFEFARNEGAAMEDYVGYARREIIAPADGVVVFARNDIPDGAVKSDFLKMPNGITAPAGNVVIIDHGQGEFSIFCHLHYGSVIVKTGDAVRQGARIGLLGAAGSPGLPHLHYQLQSGPNIFGNDGLPLVFTNIERVAWLGRSGSDDEHGSAPVSQPRAGIFMEAK
jgi:murein DD-endopeptidase MepM/ murein hydrolase activator NlpD